LPATQLNIVCFGYRGLDNSAIVADLPESGIAAPPLTRIGGRTAIRVPSTMASTSQLSVR